MKERIAHLIGRFPGHERAIKALSGESGRFQDLLSDHYDVHRQLARDDLDPARNADLKARYRNLEEELVRLIQGYPLA